jgi:CRISPR system Cascade subunit CasA
MPESFSLARRAWVPVVLSNGQRERVRLCDIASDINGLPISRVSTGRADCDVSLMEFLIGLLAVTMGPEDEHEWHDRYRSPPDPAAIDAAISPFIDALNLDGSGPRFFQDYEDLGDDTSPVEALFIDAPGAKSVKENADHFVKRERTTVLSRAGAAIALLTLQTMAPAGGAGHRTSLRGGGPLTTLIEPPRDATSSEPRLWQRLWVNVLPNLRGSPKEAKLIFPWLGPTRTSNPKEKGETTTPDHVHKAHAFFGMPRRIRLTFEPNTDRKLCDLTGEIDDAIVRSYVTRPWGTNYAGWSQGHALSP